MVNHQELQAAKAAALRALVSEKIPSWNTPPGRIIVLEGRGGLTKVVIRSRIMIPEAGERGGGAPPI